MESLFTTMHPLWLLSLGCGVLMAWGMGANDFANSGGPAIGAGMLSRWEALVMVAIFEMVGVLFYGFHGTSTLGQKILAPALATADPQLLLGAMLASLLGAALWLGVASAMGWPVSATHSIYGAIVGVTMLGIGLQGVQWSALGPILLSWLISPLLGALIGYLLMLSIDRLVLQAGNSVVRARRLAPLYVFIAAFVVCLGALRRDLRSLGIDLNNEHILVISLTGGVGMVLIALMQQQIVRDAESCFAPITLFTLCSMAFAHGTNDIANSVEPMAIAINLLAGQTAVTQGAPLWLFALGGVAMLIGMASFGSRVAHTLGRGITPMTPSRAFSVGLAASVTVLLASGGGFPVSSTHTIVGAVVGVGLVSGAGAVHAGLMKSILVSWLMTIPVAAILAALFYLGLNAL